MAIFPKASPFPEKRITISRKMPRSPVARKSAGLEMSRRMQHSRARNPRMLQNLQHSYDKWRISCNSKAWVVASRAHYYDKWCIIRNISRRTNPPIERTNPRKRRTNPPKRRTNPGKSERTRRMTNEPNGRTHAPARLLPLFGFTRRKKARFAERTRTKAGQEYRTGI